MRVLLDTAAFLWAVSDDPEFSQEAREVFTDPGNEIYLSSVSAWEIAVKHALGKLPLPEPPGRFVPLHASSIALIRCHWMKTRLSISAGCRFYIEILSTECWFAKRS